MSNAPLAVPAELIEIYDDLSESARRVMSNVVASLEDGASERLVAALDAARAQGIGEEALAVVFTHMTRSWRRVLQHTRPAAVGGVADAPVQ